MKIVDEELMFTLKDSNAMHFFLKVLGEKFSESVDGGVDNMLQMEIYEPKSVMPGPYIRIKLQQEPDGSWSLVFNKKAYLKNES